MSFKSFFGHLHTVGKHRRAVRYFCFQSGLIWQGLTHDLSKYSAVEFWNGVKHYTGKGSPHIGERKTKGYSDAWMHHKGRNKHHMDYWTDISLEDGYTKSIQMPFNYFVELICDRVGAAMAYGGKNYDVTAPLKYFLKSRHENVCHKETDREVEVVLRYLADHGEKETFKVLKTALKTWRKDKSNFSFDSFFPSEEK